MQMLLDLSRQVSVRLEVEFFLFVIEDSSHRRYPHAFRAYSLGTLNLLLDALRVVVLNLPQAVEREEQS